MTISPVRERFKSLPPNTAWDKDTAPEERFSAIMKDALEMKKEIVQKIEKEGTASPETIESVRNSFQDLYAGLEESRPVYPDPRQFASPNSYYAGCSVQYFVNLPRGSKLVEYHNISHHTRVAVPFSDVVDWEVSNLIQGYEKIEKFVVKSLKEPGPASKQMHGFFKKRPVSEVVEELFKKQEAWLAMLWSDASMVKAFGIKATTTV